MYVGITVFFGFVALLTVFDIRAAVAKSRESSRLGVLRPRVNGDGRSGPVVLAGPAATHYDGGGGFDGGGFDGDGGD